MPDYDDLVFTVRPRLLRLLGDQLIRDANLAVFELVKNAYDADATLCSVRLNHPDDPKKATIIVADNGSGMNEEILRDMWMVIGTGFREEQRKAKESSPRFRRSPLGEKGLGRLSIHKLGRSIRLITRKKHEDEFFVDFDWERLENADNFASAGVKLQSREPKTFPGEKHGTKLIVTNLRESWSRGDVRRLNRAVNSLSSPFDGPSNFRVRLSVPQHEEWLKGLLGPSDINDCALYYVRGYIEGGRAQFNYEFTPPATTDKKLTKRSDFLSDLPLVRKGDQSEGEPKLVFIDLTNRDIGRIDFEFRLFDRDPSVLRAVTDDAKGLREYLKENGGIWIYRDGIRVYDFGEPGNDWLNLDARRVNTPTAKTSNSQILGALRLDSKASSGLREKSNREGFIENKSYYDFKCAIISILNDVEAEKTKDQKRVREALGKGTGRKLFDRLTDLREILASKGVLEEIDPKIKEVEKEIEIYRDQLLHAAVPGLTLGIILHGAEKILEELYLAARKGDDISRIKELVNRLYRAMRPVTNLLKNPGVAKTSASILIKEAIFSNELRLKRHGVQLIRGGNEVSEDFTVRGSKPMLIASITNLIDNSIHWLEMKNPVQKFLYIGITRDLEGGPAIVVADNGPGFGNDNPEDLLEPFFSRRLGGMGLGLYIVSEVMRVNKANLVFPERHDVELSDNFDGAVVALQFPDIS